MVISFFFSIFLLGRASFSICFDDLNELGFLVFGILFYVDFVGEFVMMFNSSFLDKLILLLTMRGFDVILLHSHPS